MGREPRGLRNNNPLNIRLDGTHWQGEKEPSGDKSFKQFTTMAWGYRAAMVIIRTYYTKYNRRSVSRIIYRWAPPSENDTEAYIDTVCAESGLGRFEVLDITSKDDMIALVAAMSYVENGVKAVMKDVVDGWKLYNGNKS